MGAAAFQHQSKMLQKPHKLQMMDDRISYTVFGNTPSQGQVSTAAIRQGTFYNAFPLNNRWGHRTSQLLSLNKANKPLGWRAKNTLKFSDMQESDAPLDPLKKPSHWGLLVSEEPWLMWLYSSCRIQESAPLVLTDLNIRPLCSHVSAIFFASGIQSFSQQLLPAEHSPQPQVRAGIRS